MKPATKETVVSCPDCGRTINLGTQPQEGKRATCLKCGAYLEIISLEPLEVNWATSESEEGWGISTCQWSRPLGRKAARQHWRWAAST